MTTRLIFAFAVAILAAAGQTVAQTPDSTRVGNCEPAKAESMLDVGNVRALIRNDGIQFFNGSEYHYEVPRDSGIHALFSTGLYVGGIGADGTLRLSGARFQDAEFWPGPAAAVEVESTGCRAFDRIEESRWSEGPGGSTGTRAGLLTSLFDLENTHDAQRPKVSEVDFGEADSAILLGDQMLTWKMNDLGNTHQTTEKPPVGLDIAAAAYGFDAPAPLGNTTFFLHRITYIGPDTLSDAYVGLHVEGELGDPSDNMIGTDTTLSMAFFYNGEDVDRGYYGVRPPALGITVLSSPTSGSGRGALTNTMPNNYFCGIAGCDFERGWMEYRAMKSVWDVGRPLTEGFGGLLATQPQTDYYMPGDPLTRAFWSMLNVDGSGREVSPGSRRIWLSSGPSQLIPGETYEFTYAIVWSRGTDRFDSLRLLRQDVDLIRSFGDLLTTPRSSITTPQPRIAFAGSVYPNPASDRATLRLSLPRAMTAGADVFDVLGRRVFSVDIAERPAGDYRFDLPTGDWTPGLYLVRIRTGHVTDTRQLIVAR